MGGGIAMRKISFIAAVLALVAASCAKEAPIEKNISEGTIAKTFTVSAPDTKTALDGMSVKWSAGDEINVIAATSGNQYTFTIKSEAAGSDSAAFTGEIAASDASETTFYAVYPNVAIRVSGDSNQRDLEHGYLTLDQPLPTSQNALENGFDPRSAVMTAKADASGNFAFRHAMAYFKLRIAVANVTSVYISTNGSARFGGRPVLEADTGAASNVDGAKNNITLAASSGTLVKGAVYYVPVCIKSATLKTLSLKYSFNDGTSEKTVSTDNKKDEILEAGKVYDLGCPPVKIAPEIDADNVSLDASATSGSITYSIVNPVAGGTLAAALKQASDWLTVGAVSDGSVALTSTANTGDARNAVVVLTYTYNTDLTVTKEVTVSQKAGSGGAAESHVRIIYNGNEELLDGDEATSPYFTHSTSYVSLSASANNGGGIDSYTIPGTSISVTKSLKLDSSGYLRFTTSPTLSSKVSFYYVMRKSGSGKIQITPSGGTATVYDDVAYGSVNSKTVSLEKDTEYTIARNSGEILLLAAVVNETE